MRRLRDACVQMYCPGRNPPSTFPGFAWSERGVGLTEATSKEEGGALVCAAETTAAHASRIVATRIIGPPSDSGVYFSSGEPQPANLRKDVVKDKPWRTA